MVGSMARRLSGCALLAAMAWMAVASTAALGQTGSVPAATNAADPPSATAAAPQPGGGLASRQAAGAAAKLEFEVASVRPSAPLDPVKMRAAMQSGQMPNFGAHVNASRATYSYMTLKALVANAYGVKEYQVAGPDWLGSERFDIVAKMPEGASTDDAPQMLQALLAERFKMEAHSESQEHPVLALVVGKDGPKLKASPAAAAPVDPDAPLKPGEMTVNTPQGPARMTQHSDGSSTINMGAKGTYRIKMDGQTMHLDADTMTMAGFADMLTSVMQMGGGGGKQVVDMTGLKGNYQVAVDISLAAMMAAAQAQGMNSPMGAGGAAASGATLPDASDPGGGGATVYESVEKLGLKLEPRKAMVQQVVVDSAEKTPTEN